jgi:small GTP-binding protein
MPMPHRTFAEVAKRRLVGKEGSERVATIRALLGELPGYRNGPYADLRKWLEGELERTRVRGKVLHRDSLQVRREGVAQIALVGPPNAGKSSLLQALSQIQIKTGDYAFTTLRPVPALTRIGGVLVQLVEIPGLIEGAHEDRGGGRALLGVLRNADAIVYCRAANEPASVLGVVLDEVAAAGIDKPAIVAMTKADEVATEEAAQVAPDEELQTVAVSILDDESLDRLREAIWSLTGLIRVFPRSGGRTDDEPFALPAGATVADLADRVHHELGAVCSGALVWGPSARFDGQRVGRGHVLADGDIVEVLTR